MTSIEDHVRAAVRLAADNVAAGQFPFAALVVADGGAGEVLGTGVNTCRRDADPTAHGEVQAIRDACRRLGSFDLSGAIVVSSCEPCGMCQTVAASVGIRRVIFVDRIEVGRRVSGPLRIALEVDDSAVVAERLVTAGAAYLGEGPVVTPWKDRNVRLAAPGGVQLTLFTPLD